MVTRWCFTFFVIGCGVSCSDAVENSGFIGDVTNDSGDNDARVIRDSSSILNGNNVQEGSDDTERDDVRENSVASEDYSKDKVQGGSGGELGADFCSSSRFVDDMVRLH